MSSIFTGFLFIFLDFSLNLSHSSIELIPDFIGYIILLGGLREMAAVNRAFHKVRPFAVAMAFYTGIVWFLELFGVGMSLGLLSLLLGLASHILSLYISYKIMMGVIDMEYGYNTSLNGSSLKTAWNILMISSILSYPLLLIPFLAFLCILVSAIASICFLVAFHRSKTLYNNIGPHNSL